MSPGSNSSNNNNQAGSPSSITSPIMTSVPPTSSDMETPSTVAPNTEGVLSSDTHSWTPPDEDQDSPQPQQEPQSRGIASPQITSPYHMMTSMHNAGTMKTEISSPLPANGSPGGMLPQYGHHSVSRDNPGGYISSVHQPTNTLPSQPMMQGNGYWYETEPIDGRGLRETAYLK